MNDKYDKNDEAELLASILADAKKVNNPEKGTVVEPEIVETPVVEEIEAAEIDSSDDALLLESILEDAQKVSGKTAKLPEEKKVVQEKAKEDTTNKDDEPGFSGLSLGSNKNNAPKLNPKFQVKNETNDNDGSGASVSDFNDNPAHSARRLPTRSPQNGRRQVNPLFNVSKSTPKRGKLPLNNIPDSAVDNSVNSGVNKGVDNPVENTDENSFSGLNLGKKRGLPQNVSTPVDKGVESGVNRLPEKEIEVKESSSDNRLPTVIGNDTQGESKEEVLPKRGLPVPDELVNKGVDNSAEESTKTRVDNSFRGDPLTINTPVDNPVDNLPKQDVNNPVDNSSTPSQSLPPKQPEQGKRERWLPDADAGRSRGFKPFLGGENNQGKRVRDAARKKVIESASDEGLIVEPDDLPEFTKPPATGSNTQPAPGTTVSLPKPSERLTEANKNDSVRPTPATTSTPHTTKYREGDNIEDIVPLGRQGNRVDNVDVGDWAEDSKGTSAGLQGEIEIAERKLAPKGIKLTNNDIIILRFLARYRYAYIDVLARLVDKEPRVLGRRLNILNNHGYLRKEIITDRQGLWTNRRAGNAVVDMNFPDIKKGDISPMQIAHTIGVANLAVEFEREAGGKDFLGEGKGVPGWLPPYERWKYGIWGYEGKESHTRGYMTFSEREIRHGQMRNKGLRTAEEMRGLIHNAIMDPNAPEMGEGQEWLFSLYGAGNAGGDHIPDLVVLRPRDAQGKTQHAAIELELGIKKASEWVRILRQYRDKGEMFDKIYYFTHRKDIHRGLMMADESVGLGDRLVIRKYEPKNRAMPFWG